MRLPISCLLLAACPALAMAGAQAVRPTAQGAEVLFTFSPQIAVGSVSLAGTFNGWSKDAHPLLDPEADGVYALALPLPSGRHLYKFVIDGREWTPDPENPARDPDGFGGFNSVVVVGNPAPASARGDGRIDLDALNHGPGIEYREALPAQGLAGLRLRAAADDLQSVRLMDDRGRERFLTRAYAKGGYEYWELEVPHGNKPFSYCFELRDGDARVFLGRRGAAPTRPALKDLFVFDAKAPRLDVPAWVADAVFYQIFPERFANGDSSNDPPGAEAWGSTPTIANRFGGDLDGIAAQLTYLKALGVNALYLNPVFAAPSSHKYDTADYMRIDPSFGGDAAFQRLTRACRREGVRIVLDGVFNHSGDSFWAFQDVLKNGAASRYASWYTVRSFPVTQSPPNYECWWGFGHLPKLNTGDPAARASLMKVGVRWLAMGASGWRLDVPNEVPHAFWKEFRTRVRRARADAYIVGEIWDDGLPWLEGDEFDAVMNYPFRRAVHDFFGPRRAPLEEFHEALLEPRHRYPRASLPAQFNLLGSHDTPRLATAFDGHRPGLKLAVLFQMTYLGAPVVYYGDEVGLRGGKDPDCRRTFPWDPDRQDAGLLEHYRRLIRIRRERPELRRGGFETVLMDGDRGVYAFERRLGDAASLVVLHRGDGEAPADIALPPSLARCPALRDLYSGRTHPVRDGRLALTLAPWEGIIAAGCLSLPKLPKRRAAP